MIHDTLKRIQNEIETTISDNVKKNELLSLIDNLRVEIDTLKREDAKSITTFAEASFSEATREIRDEELFSHAIEGLNLSVRRFEVSHPKLIGLINSIGRMLSDIGV